MPSSVGEAVAIAISCAGLVVQLLVPGALFYWGRRVAARHGRARAWRVASLLPLAAFGVGVVGIVGTVLGLVHAFGAVARAEPATRATFLAQGISEAMNATAFGLVASGALYLASIAAFLYGTFARPRS